jgi:hypothetical protein
VTSEPVLTNSALGGIIAAGAVILLLLLALCLLLVLLGVRRHRNRRPKVAPFKMPAHDNPTYMNHAEIAAATAGTGSPVDVSFAADGGAAGGITFAFDFDKFPMDEKKIPPSFQDVEDAEDKPDAGAFYAGLSSLDEKIKKMDDDGLPEYTVVSCHSPGLEPSEALPKYENEFGSYASPY